MSELKVVLLGVPSVGKTSLFQRFVNDDYSGLEAPTLPSDGCGRRKVTPGHQGGLAEATIVLWDTAGEERFHDFNAKYYSGSSAAVVCYDLSDYTTLLKSAFWIADLAMRLPHAVLFLCGCKSDLQLAVSTRSSSGLGAETDEDFTMRQRRRHVDSEMLRNFARQHNIPQERLFSVSAKTGHQVTQLFEAVAASCLSSKQQQQQQQQLHRQTASREQQQQQQQQQGNSIRELNSLASSQTAQPTQSLGRSALLKKYFCDCCGM